MCAVRSNMLGAEGATVVAMGLSRLTSLRTLYLGCLPRMIPSDYVSYDEPLSPVLMALPASGRSLSHT